MKLLSLLLLLQFTLACAAPQLSPMQEKRQKILECLKELKQTDTNTTDAFEVCRQLYGLHKID